MSPCRCATDAEIADHDRDLRKHEPHPRFDQLTAVAKLAGYCEGVCESGVLTEESESQLRRLVLELLIAFEMPTQAEREVAS